jgi:hypothetical protein
LELPSFRFTRRSYVFSTYFIPDAPYPNKGRYRRRRHEKSARDQKRAASNAPIVAVFLFWDKGRPTMAA